MILDRAIEAIARVRAPKEPPAPIGAEIASPLFERPSCPLCGNTRGDVVVIGRDDWVGADHGGQAFAVVRCAICAVRYTSPRFARAHKRRAFGGEYPFYVRSRSPGALAGRALAEARHPFEGRAGRVAARCPQAGRLLDVGCGDGLFGDVMRSRGWHVVGVDNEPDVVAHAADHLGLEAHVSDMEEDDLPEGPFEAATLWGVLQLAYDPRALLSKVRSVLIPGGLLAVGVSNIRSAGAALFGSRWRGLGLPRHLVHFTPESLARLVGWCGFEVVGTSFETPRWIVAGSIDGALSRGRRPAKALLYAAAAVAGRTARADTMEIYARRIG